MGTTKGCCRYVKALTPYSRAITVGEIDLTKTLSNLNPTPTEEQTRDLSCQG